MTLSDYLSLTNQTPAGFARAVGKSRQSVHKWMRGEAYPRREVAEEIARLTSGAVTANDFLGCAPTEQREAC